MKEKENENKFLLVGAFNPKQNNIRCFLIYKDARLSRKILLKYTILFFYKRFIFPKVAFETFIRVGKDEEIIVIHIYVIR